MKYSVEKVEMFAVGYSNAFGTPDYYETLEETAKGIASTMVWSKHSKMQWSFRHAKWMQEYSISNERRLALEQRLERVVLKRLKEEFE